jgi:drug/metabolite transporter (DMT)-like permease
VAVFIGVLVAASFGSGDFLGGLASRQVRTLSVLAIAQLAAVALAVVATLVGGGTVTPHIGLDSAAAGVLNVAALGCLYRGLAVGRIGQVAPVAAVVAAVVPITWGLATGEHLSVVTLIGVILAVTAGGLVSSERSATPGPLLNQGVALALAAGVGFGTSFILFSSASHHSGYWPVLFARLAAVIAVGVAVLVVRAPLSMPVGPRRQAIGAGLLDALATVLLLLALRHGLTATVAPVAALAPGFTVMHAWWYLHERASRVQIAGLVVALTGLAMIAAG